MLHQPTVFVLGAGSSYEAGLPVGGGLAESIAELFNYKKNDYGRQISSAKPVIYDAITTHLMTLSGSNQAWNTSISTLDIQPYINAGRFLQQGIVLANSIDDFLDLHATDTYLQLVGRLSIAHEIQMAEQRSKLFKSKDVDDVDIHNVMHTFYVKMFKMLSKGVGANSINTIFDNVTFITFNYDRTLEHFLVRALCRLYKTSVQTASELVSSAKIWHPYGAVGSLPNFQGGEQISKYGNVSEAPELLEISKGIATYTEKVSDFRSINRTRDAIALAKSVVFLGFGFHEQNMALLKPSLVSEHKHIYATAFGVSEPNCDVIRESMRDFLPHQQPDIDKPRHITIRSDLTCAAFFDEYALPLTKR